MRTPVSEIIPLIRLRKLKPVSERLQAEQIILGRRLPEIDELFPASITIRFANGAIIDEKGGVILFYLSLVQAFTAAILFREMSPVIVGYDEVMFCRPGPRGISLHQLHPSNSASTVLALIKYSDAGLVVADVKPQVIDIIGDSMSIIEEYVLSTPFSELRYLLSDNAVRL